MKIVTAQNGKKTVKISKSEWQSIGKKAKWIISQAVNPNRGTIELGDTGEVQQSSQELYQMVSQLTPDQKFKIMISMKTQLQRWPTEEEVNDLIANGLMAWGVTDNNSLTNYINKLN